MQRPSLGRPFSSLYGRLPDLTTTRSMRRPGGCFRKQRLDYRLELIERDRLAQDRPAPEQGRQQFRPVARREQKRFAAALDQVGDRVDIEALQIDVENGKIVLRGHRESARI